MVLSTIISACVLLACHDNITGLRHETARTALEVAGPLVVSPGNMQGWSFVDDQLGVACADTTVCRLVAGPSGQPSGGGSAELATAATNEGKALVLQSFKGTRFDAITELRYWTYRQSDDAGNNLAIALQVNADYDLADQSAGYQGRLVFEPYQGAGGSVTTGTWQEWDTRAGRWWGTRASVTHNGVSVANPCVQATPCTWAQLLAAFPNVGVHPTYGAVVLKAGSGWASFRGNVDALTIAVNGATTTYDFEVQEPAAAFPATFPHSIPDAMWDTLAAPGNVLENAPSLRGRVIRDLLFVVFRDSASLTTRAAAVASVGGRVVGGELLGFYAIRIPYVLTTGDSASGPLLRARAILRSNAAVRLANVERLGQVRPKYVRPNFGAGFDVWPLSPDSAIGVNWNLVGIDAPFAWGCVTGKEPGATRPVIAIVDEGFHAIDDLKTNLGTIRELSPKNAIDTTEHGTKVASA